MKILIVENDPFIVEDLKDKLEILGYVNTVSVDNVSDASKEISNRIKPNVVLVDIELNGDKNGIELGAILNEKNIPFIYLSKLQDTNTFNKAKATNPQANLVKPVSVLQLRNSIAGIDFDEKKESNSAFIFVTINKKKQRLQKNEITHLKAARNYCDIFLGSKKHVSSTPMGNVLNVINSSDFIRVHKSYAVNITKIISISGNMIVVDGASEDPIPISDKYRSNLMRKIESV